MKVILGALSMTKEARLINDRLGKECGQLIERTKGRDKLKERNVGDSCIFETFLNLLAFMRKEIFSSCEVKLSRKTGFH